MIFFVIFWYLIAGSSKEEYANMRYWDNQDVVATEDSAAPVAEMGREPANHDLIGGGKTNLSYDISTLTMTKLFQVWWWFYFREKFFQILDQAENFGRLFVFLKSALLKFSSLEYG